MSIKTTRPVSWISSARKALRTFQQGRRQIILSALTIAAEGGKADIAKPMKGLAAAFLKLPYLSGGMLSG